MERRTSPRYPFFPTVWGMLADNRGTFSSRRFVGLAAAGALIFAFLVSGTIPAILHACGGPALTFAFDPKLTDALTWLAVGGILGATADHYSPKARAEAELAKTRAAHATATLPGE